MNLIRCFIVIMISMLLSACATTQPVVEVNRVDPLRENPRIVFRDLTMPALAQKKLDINDTKTNVLKQPTKKARDKLPLIMNAQDIQSLTLDKKAHYQCK